jgi:hypothetical protein
MFEPLLAGLWAWAGLRARLCLLASAIGGAWDAMSGPRPTLIEAFPRLRQRRDGEDAEKQGNRRSHGLVPINCMTWLNIRS